MSPKPYCKPQGFKPQGPKPHWQRLAEIRHERSAIIGALTEHGEMTLDELAQATGMSRTRTRVRVLHLISCGDLAWALDAGGEE